MPGETLWKRCNACKEPIELGSTYWVCSVSTCNRKRTALAFCTVSCWDAHLPIANHREAWAVEKTAPRTAEAPPTSTPAKPDKQEKRAPRRTLPRSAPGAKKHGSAAPRSRPQEDVSPEVLIVASRLKDYIRAQSGFNTSERVLDPLSEIVRRVCDRAIRNARNDGRKTVLDRDIPDA